MKIRELFGEIVLTIVMFKTMDLKKTFGNHILIRLDAENDHIKLKGGMTLYVDSTYDPEKHATVTGTVFGLPSHLTYTGKANVGMPWKTDMELQEGDKVIVYYLAILNAFKPEQKRFFTKDNERYVFIPYQSIFVAIRGDQIIPINGYVLVEPCGDPWMEETKNRFKKIGIELVTNDKSNTNVSFGIVRYIGKPNKGYCDYGNIDDGVNVKVGDKVVLRKISDIPLQYPLHAKLDGGKLFWRVQRRKILAVI
jgi:hypothetical protein